MKITIHRGANQIGGCITEIQSSKGNKILIDLGHNLPNGDDNADDVLDKQENLNAILKGVSDIFYSHYHGDHIGFEAKIPATIKQHMGELAIKMVSVLKHHMIFAKDLKDDAEASLNALCKFEPYKAFERVQYGDIFVTPLPVSHSAVDAYMFLIECDGCMVLHSGDFRDHGYYATQKLDAIKNYLAQNVDVLITEGTMLGRGDKRVMSEQELQNEAVRKLKGRYNFILCSSMDIDRIVSFSKAREIIDKRIRIIADSYQVAQIKTVKKELPYPYSELFAYPYGRDMKHEFPRMKRYGFMMFVRDSPSFEKRIDEVIAETGILPSEINFVYSQFEGYIKEDHKAFRPRLCSFVHRYNWNLIKLHTSGHASKEALRRLVEITNPQMAIIPIHKEKDSNFAELQLDSNLQDKIVTQSKCFEKQVGDQKVRVEIEIK